MYEGILAQPVAYLPIAAIAVLLWWAMLRRLDQMGGIHFRRDVMPRILDKDPGRYFGCRAIAVAIVVGAVFLAVRF